MFGGFTDDPFDVSIPPKPDYVLHTLCSKTVDAALLDADVCGGRPGTLAPD